MDLIKEITSHPQFWAVVGLSYGIASDVIGANKRIKQNTVLGFLLAQADMLVKDYIGGKSRRR